MKAAFSLVRDNMFKSALSGSRVAIVSFYLGNVIKNRVNKRYISVEQMSSNYFSGWNVYQVKRMFSSTPLKISN